MSTTARIVPITTYNDGIEVMRIDSNGALGIGVGHTVVLDDDPVLQHLRCSESEALDRILQDECAHLGAWRRYNHLGHDAHRLYVCVQCGMYKRLAEELDLD